MGGMEGPAVQAIKLELEKARSASKKPPLNVEIEEARKFITRSERRLKELEEERRERGSSHPVPPQDVNSQVTDLQQMVNMLQAERDTLDAELQSRGGMRRVEKLHPPQSSEEAAENF